LKDMARESSGGIGGCLGFILMVLIIGAAFGFFEWDTVGTFVRFLIYMAVGGVVIWIVFMLIAFIFSRGD